MNKVNCREVKDNVIKEFRITTALVTARKKDGSFNTCTIGWGTIGELWSKDVCIVYVKPIRYTAEFLDEDDYFTVTFFKEGYQEALNICGTKSGKDVDKIQLAGLKPIELEHGVIYEGYKRAYVCKKIYKSSFLKENFIESEEIINRYYKDEPCHNVYIGEIIETIE